MNRPSIPLAGFFCLCAGLAIASASNQGRPLPCPDCALPGGRAAVLLLSGAAGEDQPPNTLTKEQEEAGWILLFDGETLDGWVLRNGSAEFRVEDGAIVGTTATGSPNSFLCTEEDYGDFELEFECLLVDNQLNSGLQIRSLSLPDVRNGRVHGPQVEIMRAPGASGYIYSEGTGRGWLSQDRSINDAVENHQWNHYRVLAEGPRIRTWINGRQIEDLTDEESSMKGFIGLQVHSIPRDQGPYEVKWRSLRLRPLDGGDAEPAAE